MADIFHTFFGLCGFSLLGYFASSGTQEEGGEGKGKVTNGNFVPINPTYALPEPVVAKFGLKYQTLPRI
jgi:prenyltransferase beta subunit